LGVVGPTEKHWESVLRYNTQQKINNGNSGNATDTRSAPDWLVSHCIVTHPRKICPSTPTMRPCQNSPTTCFYNNWCRCCRHLTVSKH